jgi:hypothetical protein
MNIILFGVFEYTLNRVVVFRGCNQKGVGGFDFIFELFDPLWWVGFEFLVEGMDSD